MHKERGPSYIGFIKDVSRHSLVQVGTSRSCICCSAVRFSAIALCSWPPHTGPILVAQVGNMLSREVILSACTLLAATANEDGKMRNYET